MEGIEFESDSKEGKIIRDIVDVLGNVADAVKQLDMRQSELEGYLNSIDRLPQTQPRPRRRPRHHPVLWGGHRSPRPKPPSRRHRLSKIWTLTTIIFRIFSSWTASTSTGSSLQVSLVRASSSLTCSIPTQDTRRYVDSTPQLCCPHHSHVAGWWPPIGGA